MPSFATILRHAECWTESRLRKRAELWPTPLTWIWFLGERCAQYSRAEILDILAVAISYVSKARVSLPMSVGQIWRARVAAETSTVLAAMRELGAYLDQWDAGEREFPAELDAALRALCAPPAAPSSGEIGVSLPPLLVDASGGVVFEETRLPPPPPTGDDPDPDATQEDPPGAELADPDA